MGSWKSRWTSFISKSFLGRSNCYTCQPNCGRTVTCYDCGQWAYRGWGWGCLMCIVIVANNVNNVLSMTTVFLWHSIIDCHQTYPLFHTMICTIWLSRDVYNCINTLKFCYLLYVMICWSFPTKTQYKIIRFTQHNCHLMFPPIALCYRWWSDGTTSALV